MASILPSLRPEHGSLGVAQRYLPLLAIWALLLGSQAMAAPCSGEAVLTVVADNQSADTTVELHVTGTRLPSGSACDAQGSELTSSYSATVICSGAGTVVCLPRISGLAPGPWVHRVSLQVAGSDEQRQAQQGVILASVGNTASNVVDWSVFGRTFVVTHPTGTDLRTQIDAARDHTAMHGSPALVRFDADAAPDAANPTRIQLQTAPTCDLDTCLDGRKIAYCFEGLYVTVDALDGDGNPGGVVLSIGTCHNSLLRLYGGGNTLRGLVFEGSTYPVPASCVPPPVPAVAACAAVDTIVIAGMASGHNLLDRCSVIGPTLGDGISIEGIAEDYSGGVASKNFVTATTVAGAQDKGVKIASGGNLQIDRSCVHDNLNGGIQVTLGGSATVVENIVQHNTGRSAIQTSAENGISVGPEKSADSLYPNVLATRGNIVRFHGQRGISIVNHATAALNDDVVTDNHRAGVRVQSVFAPFSPIARIRGTMVGCNFAPGVCSGNANRTCRSDEDLCSCSLGSGSATGVGIVFDEPCGNCSSAAADLGSGGLDGGRNAIALNANPVLSGPVGYAGRVNFASGIIAAAAIPLAGNQWEHCDVPISDPADQTRCYMDQVAANDVHVKSGATPVDLGAGAGPRYGSPPVVTAISPPRPRAGDLVRAYGGPFNAIDGAACSPPGIPEDACSGENSNIVARNAADPAKGNSVSVTMDGAAYSAEVHQVTPSMLVFKMPVDCDAPGVLTVSRGSIAGTPVVLCEPGGSEDRPAGAPCDDGSVCTAVQVCQPDGSCGGEPLDCDDANPCTTDACDPESGCTHSPLQGCPSTTTTSIAATTSTSTITTTTIGPSSSTTATSTLPSTTSTTSSTTSTTLPACPSAGLEAISCALRSLPPDECRSDLLPTSFTRQVSRAIAAVERATATGSSKKRRKLLRALAGDLKTADRVIRKAEHAKGGKMLSAGCVGSIRRVVGDARGTLAGVNF